MKILLGYEVNTGREVYIESSHIVVTGLTQKSGKTTTLEALARRSNQTVLVFQTKPGESALMGEYHTTPPFFTEHSDWQYVESLLSAVMKEKMKFERSWIIRATKGTASLKEVDERCEKLLSYAKEGSLEQSIFTNLHAYFGIVLPELARVEKKVGAFSHDLDLKQGINLMDLTDMKDEVQSLIIRSVLEFILQKLKGITCIISELWKFAPEGRGNPVKQVLESLIRQGAGQNNFLWFDSQDLAGVDKAPLKQVFTWIMGLQTERNEVQHTLDQIPLGKKEKPAAEDIMKLQIGHFILATPQMVKQVYVQPSWLDAEAAKGIALGMMRLEDVPQVQARFRQAQESVMRAESMNEPVYKTLYEKEKKIAEEALRKLREEVEPAMKLLAEAKAQNVKDHEEVEKFKTELERLQRVAKEFEALDRFFMERIENALDQKLQNLQNVPRGTSVTVTQTMTELHLEKHLISIKMDDMTIRGKILSVLPKDKWLSAREILELMEQKKWTPHDAVVGAELKQMSREGLLGRKENPTNRAVSYALPDNVKIITEKDATIP